MNRYSHSPRPQEAGLQGAGDSLNHQIAAIKKYNRVLYDRLLFLIVIHTHQRLENTHRT